MCASITPRTRHSVFRFSSYTALCVSFLALIPYTPLATHRCRAGDAVITNAHGRLLAKFVVHAVGPYFFGGDTNQDSSPEAQMLANAYFAALARAQSVGAQSICFPAISCGVRNCPHTLGAKIALATVAAVLQEGRQQGLLSRVEFVLAAKDALGLWQAELRGLSVARSWDLTESDR